MTTLIGKTVRRQVSIPYDIYGGRSSPPQDYVVLLTERGIQLRGKGKRVAKSMDWATFAGKVAWLGAMA